MASQFHEADLARVLLTYRPIFLKMDNRGNLKNMLCEIDGHPDYGLINELGFGKVLDMLEYLYTSQLFKDYSLTHLISHFPRLMARKSFKDGLPTDELGKKLHATFTFIYLPVEFETNELPRALGYLDKSVSQWTFRATGSHVILNNQKNWTDWKADVAKRWHKIPAEHIDQEVLGTIKDVASRKEMVAILLNVGGLLHQSTRRRGTKREKASSMVELLNGAASLLQLLKDERGYFAMQKFHEQAKKLMKEEFRKNELIVNPGLVYQEYLESGNLIPEWKDDEV